MPTKEQRSLCFWAVQAPGWILLLYIIYAQGISAFGYELGVAMGTQEPAESITAVGAAFWYGFAFGDLVVYIPLLLLGLIGHMRDTGWGRLSLAAALGITVYWPVVCLAALVDARDAAGWSVASEMPYWIVCLTIVAYGAIGLVLILRPRPIQLA